MEKQERKTLQESYLQKLIVKQQATAIFEHRETELCRSLKCNRVNLPDRIEKLRSQGLDAGSLVKLAQFAQASRAMEMAREAFYSACDARMQDAFAEVCE